jgi:hypothetical protein
LLPLLSSEFRVSGSQLKIAGQVATQNWKLGTLKSGSELPHSESFASKKTMPGVAAPGSNDPGPALHSDTE